MTKSEATTDATPPSARQRNASSFLLRASSLLALILLPACSVFNGPLDFDSDDTADMQPHPRRGEMPSLIGPGSTRVRQGQFPVIHFAAESWRLTSAEEQKIRTVARWLTGNPERVLVVAGAKSGSPEYARQLSDLRAQAVRKTLISHSVPEEKILTVSFGEDAPASAADSVAFSLIGTGAEP